MMTPPLAGVRAATSALRLRWRGWLTGPLAGARPRRRPPGPRRPLCKGSVKRKTRPVQGQSAQAAAGVTMPASQANQGSRAGRPRPPSALVVALAAATGMERVREAPMPGTDHQDCHRQGQDGEGPVCAGRWRLQQRRLMCRWHVSGSLRASVSGHSSQRGVALRQPALRRPRCCLRSPNTCVRW